MKKRFLSMLLAIVMVVGLVPGFTLTASAAETDATGTCGTNVNWVLDSDGVLTISGTGDMTDYYNDADAPWNTYRNNIKSIVIEDGVTSIGNNAFNWYYNLTTVTVKGNINRIGNSAFENSYNLSDATFMGDVGTIGDEAFYFNTTSSALNLTIHGNVTSIGKNVFKLNKSVGSNHTVTLHYNGTTKPTHNDKIYDGSSNSFKIYVTPAYYANTVSFCGIAVVTPKLNITVISDGNGTAVAKYNGNPVTSLGMKYKATLVATPADGYYLKEYQVTSGDVIIDENNQFTVGQFDIEIKAIFEAIPAASYTVSFDANGGTGTMNMITVENGQPATLPQNSFEMQYYSFNGWNTAADGSGTSYAGGAEISITKNTILYAQWEPITYTVTYDANDGTGTMASATVTASGSNNYTFPECEFTPPDGKVFSGWKYGTSTNTYLPGSSIRITQNITVTAQWATPAAAVTIDDTTTNYGSLELAAKAVEGKTATIKLLDDVLLTARLTFKANNLILDLNNKSISNYYLTLYNTVSITGPGTLRGYGMWLDIERDATVTINDGVAISKNSTAIAIDMKDGSTLILNGGSITLGDTTSVQIGGQSSSTVVVNADGVADRFDRQNVYYNISPAVEPTVNPIFSDGKIWYKIDNQIEGASVAAAGSSTYDGNTYATKGATVTVSKDGLAACYCNNVEATKNQDGTFTFTMPAAVATITAEKTHVHAWEYSGNGTTITATCANTDEGCDNTNGGSVTISASNSIYNGTAKAATPTAETVGDIQNLSSRIRYQKQTGTDTWSDATATAPTDAGTYKASIIIEGVTASVTYTIQAAIPTVAWGTTTESVSYTGSVAEITPPEVTLVSSETYSGTISYSYTGTSSGMNVSGLPTNAGTYEITARIAAKGNYAAAISSNNLTLTITAKKIGIEWSNTTLTYNGQAQKPTATATGLVSGDTCEITVTGEQTNAGEYTAKATELDNPNYKLPDNVSTVFSIVPKTVDNPRIVLTPDSFVYDGKAKNPGVKVYDGTTEIDTNEYTFAYSNNTNVSTAEAPAIVIITDEAGGNYTVSGTANFTISQSAATMTAATDKTSYTYGDKITVTVNVSASGNAVSYGLRGTPAANQVAIYNETTQITEPKTVDENGNAVFEIDTVEAGLIPNQYQYTLKAVYTASSNIASAKAFTQQFTVSYLAVDAETSLEGTLGQNGWYTSDVTVKAPAGYSITTTLSGENTDWTAPVMVTSDGTTTVSYYLKNSSGQITGEKRIEVKRDTVVPVIGSVTVSNVTNDSAVVTVTASDATSGISAYTLVSHDGAAVTITDNGNGVFRVTGMLANTEYGFTATVTDAAGLAASSDSVSVNTSMIDLSDADVTITGDYVYNGQPQVPELIVVVDGKTLIPNEDYTLSYSNTNGGDGNHTDAGTVTVTITGKGDYCGETSVQFVIRKAGTVAAPVIMPGSTQFSDSLEITITCATDGAVIYYTTDGSEPTTGSTVYTEPFMITDNTTVRAFAVKANMDNSAETSEVYEKKVDSGFDYNTWYLALMMLYNREFDITATATEGGTITPAGVTKVKYSKDQLYTITPAEGYMIEDVIVDGKSIGAVEVYNFDNVRKNHTITAIFAEIPWVNPFTDISENDRFYEDIKYVYKNGLMLGANTEGTLFSPDETLNRAMLVTILWRAAGQPMVDSPVDFFDVPADQWYSDAIAWASANSIVLGYGDGIFGTNDLITREQLATILYRYEQYLGGGFTGMWMFPLRYDDAADVADWAYEAMCWLTMNDIYVTHEGDLLDPKEKATRAETAAFLHRYCEYRGEQEASN